MLRLIVVAFKTMSPECVLLRFCSPFSTTTSLKWCDSVNCCTNVAELCFCLLGWFNCQKMPKCTTVKCWNSNQNSACITFKLWIKFDRFGSQWTDGESMNSRTALNLNLSSELQKSRRGGLGIRKKITEWVTSKSVDVEQILAIT